MIAALLAQQPPTAPMEVPQGTMLLTVLMSAAITDNILLTRFLGMCPYLSVSRQMKSAFGLGLAVVFVVTCTCFLNSLLYWYGIRALGLPPSLQLILYIVVIAAFVQLMEMVIERLSIGLYFSLGIFLPLITVNCAILGTSLFMTNTFIEGSEVYRPLEVLVYGFGSGVGWLIAIVLLGGIRQKLRSAKIPAGLEGPGIALIITGIMALAFIGFAGIIKL
jgi:Na+-transporting NADH:ubiquinone oxidoreductase subunit E